jgi:ATP-binding cassette subfamily B (MDR/TAP) protein 1
MTVQFACSFIAGIVLGFTQCWQLALAMSSILPCIMLTGALMGKFITRYTQCVLHTSISDPCPFNLTHRRSTDGIASAGSIAEESISTIRTAKAFGIQSHLGVLFDDKVVKAGRNGMKLAIVQGVGFGVFFFISYSAYGLGESWSR